MNQPYDVVRAVENPADFIKANVDAKPSGLRHLLREMQSRKRLAQDKPRDKALLKEVSPSAFDRVMRRRQGQPVRGSLERETSEEKELKKIMRLNDQT